MWRALDVGMAGVWGRCGGDYASGVDQERREFNPNLFGILAVNISQLSSSYASIGKAETYFIQGVQERIFWLGKE